MQNTLRDAGHFALAAALVSVATPVFAQEPGGSGPESELAGAQNLPPAEESNFPLSNAPRIYLPEEFIRTSPRTALDLIEEIPGFNVQGGGGPGGGGGGGGRGFGEASGNLLINGDRISSKSTSTRDELSRIPIGNVLRIEIVDGATLDIPGLSGQVANVIVESSGLSGQFNWRPQFSSGPAPVNWSEGNVSVRGSTSGVDYSIAFESNAFVRGSEGLAIFTDADGVIDERFNTQTAQFNRPKISGSFAFDIAPDVSVNLNLSGGLTIFRAKEQETRLATNPMPAFLERFQSRNNEHYYEIGGDIEFPLGPGRLKLITLESFDHGNFRTQSLLDLGILATSGAKYQRLDDIGERIARAEYSWGMLGGDWQLSGEAAFNRLDNVASLFSYEPATEEFVEIAFPAGTGGVREERFESILSYSTSLTSNLSLQIAIGGEYSSISQTGANALARTFQRPKGTFSLAWAPSDGLDISLEVARRVGQLDFGDFLGSVNLSEENQSTGNNQLRPQQSWEAELEVSKIFGVWGSATLAVFDHRVEDFLIIVPTIGGGESRGNIDSARRYGLRFNGTLELAAMGWQGAKLDVQVHAENSNLQDPVTFVRRRFDRNSPFEIRLDFRHDVPETDWAWGLEFRDTQSALGFRVAEVALDYNVSTFGAIFIENKDVFGLTVRTRVGNIFDGTNVLRRTVYDGPRNNSPVLFSEDRELSIGQVFNLTVSGSF